MYHIRCQPSQGGASESPSHLRPGLLCTWPREVGPSVSPVRGFSDPYGFEGFLGARCCIIKGRCFGAGLSGAGFKNWGCLMWGSNPLLKLQVLNSLHRVGLRVSGELVQALPIFFRVGILLLAQCLRVLPLFFSFSLLEAVVPHVAVD